MTEAEWKTCADPEPMLAWLEARVAEAVLRQFAVACCHRFIGRHPSESRHQALALAEHMVCDSSLATSLGLDDLDAKQGAVDCACSSACLKSAEEAAIHASFHAQRVIWHESSEDLDERLASVREEQAVQAGLLRDIVGNPFRRVAFSRDWRTDTVVALTQRIYNSRDFGALPILADALHDAGCDNADILDHCRAPGPHVSGCWVINSLLARE